jgi:hypothetical protein
VEPRFVSTAIRGATKDRRRRLLEHGGTEATVDDDDECKCGCRRPRSGRSRFHEDHRQVAVVVRRLLRNATRSAGRQGVPCTLTWNDLLPLVLTDWPRSGEVRLEVRRIDTERGLHPDNVRLVERGGRRPPDVRSALARCATGARELGLAVDDLVDLWRVQRGSCALTGAALEPAQAAWHPLSVAIMRDRRSQPMLVSRAAHAVASTFGEDVLVDLARAVVEREGRRGRRG